VTHSSPRDYLVHPGRPTPAGQLVPTPPPSSLPAELLAAAGTRLGYTALIYAAVIPAAPRRLTSFGLE
jgi:hypothetical protein